MGGGFGALVRLLVALHGGEPTWVVFDTPIFSAVQWLYLSAVLGEDRVVLHDTAPVRPVEGRVNLVPIGLVSATQVDADLFISNWALNESPPSARQDVVDRRWFGASSLLLAMHAGDPFTEVVLAAGAKAVPLGDFLPGQQYLVAQCEDRGHRPVRGSGSEAAAVVVVGIADALLVQFVRSLVVPADPQQRPPVRIQQAGMAV